MRLILSRKGFDTGSGGGPSPIVDDRPLTLPIPAKASNDFSRTRYADIALGDRVSDPAAFCHHDPFFSGDRVAFGQAAAAQGHLRNQGVGPGDVFLFFGLFADPDSREWHHRLFGWLRVEAMLFPGTGDAPPDFAPDHPHFLNRAWPNNIVYVGPGGLARHAGPSLRLTRPGGPLSQWRIPAWLHRRRDLSYHGNAARWATDGELTAVSRGQEFVVDIGADAEGRDWTDRVIADMARR